MRPGFSLSGKLFLKYSVIFSACMRLNLLLAGSSAFDKIPWSLLFITVSPVPG
jgi:hypothetical protein